MILNRKLLLAVMLLAASLLLYTYRYPTANLTGHTYRYVYVFDISQSMNVTDAVPGDGELTRLEHAKRAGVESLSKLPCGSEVGVALFSGHRAFLLITPIEICSNYAELASIMNQVDWRMTWERSSEVAKGLSKSVRLLTLLDEETRLVFFTDGQESPPIRAGVLPRIMGDIESVRGLVVGVGGDELVEIPKFSESGQRIGVWKADEVVQKFAADEASETTGFEHLSSLRESYLQELANMAGLDYFRLRGIEEFVDRLRARSLAFSRTTITDIRSAFALLALALLVLSVLAKPRLPK
ncbi:MAG: vWA domain-containing protein [Gammaproteobacteria bacterium]